MGGASALTPLPTSARGDPPLSVSSSVCARTTLTVTMTAQTGEPIVDGRDGERCPSASRGLLRLH